MKPRNFPARKLMRQLTAQGSGWKALTDGVQKKIDAALLVRTKKRRS